jgi:hypothetical protein
MRSRLGWVIVGALISLILVGTVDAFLSSDEEDSGSKETTEPDALVDRGGTSPREEAEDEPLPPCTAQQLAVSIDLMGGSPFIAVSHAWGNPCHLRRVPIDMTVKDRTGRPVWRAWSESGVGGDFSPDFVRLIGINYQRPCGRPRPLVAFVNVGAYSTRRKLPRVDCHWGP